MSWGWVSVFDFESVGYLRTKYSFAMVYGKKWGLTEVVKSAKMWEIKGVVPDLRVWGTSWWLWGGGVRVLGCQKLKYLIYSAKCDGICVRVNVLRDLL